MADRAMRFGDLILAVAGLTLAAASAIAETLPGASIPGASITLIVPGPLGGTTDTLCRMVADRSRTPDAPIVHGRLINRSLAYDVQTFERVISLAVTYCVVAVRRGFPAHSLAELLAHSKANAGKINYASGVNGSGSDLAVRQLECLAEIEMVNIPYPGSAPSQRALVAGEVDTLIDSLPVLLPAFLARLINIVPVCAESRIAELPNVPTLAEAGLGIELLNWFGIFASRQIPASIIALLNRADNEVLTSSETRARLEAWELRRGGGTATVFAEFVVRDRKHREKNLGATTGHGCAAGFTPD